jgi:integrase
VGKQKRDGLTDGKWHPVPGHPGIWQRRRTDGSIAWAARAYDPTIKNSRHLGTFPTRRDAKAAKREFEDAFKPRRRMTLEDYQDAWLELHPKERRGSTLRTYRYGVRPFCARFGARRLDQLERVECLEWAKDAGDWAVDAARIMLNDAVNDGLLGTNPLAGLGRKRSRGRRDLEVIATEDLHAMTTMAPDVLGEPVGQVMKCFVLGLAYTGMRQSEQSALRPECVDSTLREIDVRAQLERVTGEEVDPKTGGRRIALARMAEVAFGQLPRTESPYLFTTPNGAPFTATKLAYYWHKLRAAAGHHHMQLHELRHYHATWLAYQGLPRWAIGFQLGHSLNGTIWTAAAELGFQPKGDAGSDVGRITRRYLHPEELALSMLKEALAGETRPIPRRVDR